MLYILYNTKLRLVQQLFYARGIVIIGNAFDRARDDARHGKQCRVETELFPGLETTPHLLLGPQSMIAKV
jgi:hypothetical protein